MSKTDSCNFFSFLGLGHNCILKLPSYPCPRPDTWRKECRTSSQAPRVMGLIYLGCSSQCSPGVQLLYNCGWFTRLKNPSPIQHLASLPFGGDRSICPVLSSTHFPKVTQNLKPNKVHLQVTFCPPAHPPDLCQPSLLPVFAKSSWSPPAPKLARALPAFQSPTLQTTSPLWSCLGKC